MFGFKKKQKNPENELGLEIQTMKNDLKTPFEKKHISIKIPSDETYQAVPLDNPQKQPSDSKEIMVAEEGAKGSINQYQSDYARSVETPPLEKNIRTAPDVPSARQTKAQPAFFPAENNFRKNKTEQSPREQSQPRSSVNKPLIFIIAILLLITIGTGGYYYFYILNAPADSSIIPENSPSPSPETSIDPGHQLPNQSPTAKIPSLLENASRLEVDKSNIMPSIKKNLESSAKDKNSPLNSSEGVVYLLEDTTGKALTANEIIAGFKLKMDEFQGSFKETAWIHVVKISNGKIPKVSLIFEPNDDRSIFDMMLKREDTLPGGLLGIFVNETPRVSKKEAEFKQSAHNKEIRYYNYISNNPNQSIDWAKITLKERTYILISTSRDSMQKLFDQLSANK